MAMSLPFVKVLSSSQGVSWLFLFVFVFSPLQDPSVTQLTNAPQGGLAEFNPFSEVGEHALFLGPWVLWLVLGFWGKEPWQRQRQL